MVATPFNTCDSPNARAWKEYSQRYPETEKWIRIYEARLKSKSRDKMGEIGERFVDLSSSRYPTPEYFSMVLEYEAIPKWGEIIGDFRKLLSVLAPVKVGIFHLPALRSMDRSWFQDEESGKPEWVDKVLNGDKPDEVVTDIKAEIELNALEHPYPVYLLVLIHTPMGANELTLNGYLLWRETTGKVAVEKLSAG